MNIKSLKPFLVFTKVLRIFCIIAITVCLIFLVLVFIVPDESLYSFINLTDRTLSIGNLLLVFNQNLEPVESIKSVIPFILIGTIMTLLIVYFPINILKRIIENFSKGTPFVSPVSKDLKRLSFLTLLLIIFIPIINSFETFAVLNIYGPDLIFNMENIKTVQINFNFDLALLIIPIFLYILSNVFSYGEELQKFSDETI